MFSTIFSAGFTGVDLCEEHMVFIVFIVSDRLNISASLCTQLKLVNGVMVEFDVLRLMVPAVLGVGVVVLNELPFVLTHRKYSSLVRVIEGSERISSLDI